MTFAAAAATRILIADDEAPARSRLRDVLDDCRQEFPLTIVDEARDGRQALEIVAREKVDIVLLDIRMPVMDGMETARRLAGMERAPATIFTTAFDDHAIEAFEVNAIDYLLKPIRAERLLAALKKARAAGGGRQAPTSVASQMRRHLSVQERGRIYLVPLADILYLRAEQKYVTVQTAARQFLIEKSLSKLGEEYGEVFVRVHRNCLVARAAIECFERCGPDGESGWAVVIRGTGERLAVSRRMQHVVKASRQ